MGNQSKGTGGPEEEEAFVGRGVVDFEPDGKLTPGVRWVCCWRMVERRLWPLTMLKPRRGFGMRAWDDRLSSNSQ